MGSPLMYTILTDPSDSGTVDTDLILASEYKEKIVLKCKYQNLWYKIIEKFSKIISCTKKSSKNQKIPRKFQEILTCTKV